MPAPEVVKHVVWIRRSRLKRRHKPRLYIGYYLRSSTPMDPHQALLAGLEYSGHRPSRTSYLKFHLAQGNQSGADDSRWKYEHVAIDNIQSDPGLLGLVCLGKILLPLESLDSLLQQVRIYQSCNPNQMEDTTWVASAFNTLNNEGYLSRAPTLASTDELETRSQAFAQAHGRWCSNAGDIERVPVLDLMYDKKRTGNED